MTENLHDAAGPIELDGPECPQSAPIRIYIAAFEPSGDLVAAEFVDAFSRLFPDTRFRGTGGKALARRGIVSPVDISGVSVVGVTEVLAVAWRVRRCVSAVVRDIEACEPDMVILVDSWSITSWIAKRLKRMGSTARRIKLIGPQIWATRSWRTKAVAGLFEHVFCIHDMEKSLYALQGLGATTMGHPAMGRFAKGDGRWFRERHGLDSDSILIGMLPGSRASEVRQVAPTLERAARRLCRDFPGATVVSLPPPSVVDLVRERARVWDFPSLLVADETEKADAFAAMNVALACLGTVTVELAAQETPLVCVYRIGWFSAMVARLVSCTKYFALLNVIAGREIVPEFVQDRMKPRAIAEAAGELLTNATAIRRQIAAQSRALADLGDATRPPMGTAAAKTARLLGLTAPAQRSNRETGSNTRQLTD